VNQSQISRYLKGTRNPTQKVRNLINKRFYYATKQQAQAIQDFAEDKFKTAAKDFIKKPSYKRKSGTHADGRIFVRFEFPLWRRDISDTTKLPALFEKLRFLYNTVKNESPEIKAQRLGLSISTDSRKHDEQEYFSRKAKRKYSRKKEELDFITTIIYARNKESADLMFQELQEKLQKYLMQTLTSPTLHEDEEDREAKTFFVFFEDESVEY
jgi:ribonuclease P protein component